MATHVETIGPQQVLVRRALKSILPKIDKNSYGIKLRLVPTLTFKTDDNMTARLKKVAIKHSHIVSNIKQYELDCINNIDSPISSDPKFTLRRLIMDLKADYGERFATTITQNWRGALELWVKRNTKNMLVW